MKNIGNSRMTNQEETRKTLSKVFGHHYSHREKLCLKSKVPNKYGGTRLVVTSYDEWS
jgi:hypothetical protein